MPGSAFLSLPDGPTHVAEFGGSGRPVLLVHGLGGSHTNWLAVGDRLTKYGRVLAVDLPGFGFTPPRHSFELEAHRRTVEQVLDHVGGGPAIMIGNSLGGLVAELHAAARPDQVAGLVLIAPATPLAPGGVKPDRRTATRLVMQALPGVGPLYLRSWLAGTTPEEQVWETLGMVCTNRSAVPLEVVGQAVRLAAARRRMPWAVTALTKSGRATFAYLARRERFAAMIAAITAPTLLVQGKGDKVVTTESVEWLASIRPDWRHVQMEGTAHCPQLDAHRRFLTVVESWLADIGLDELVVVGGRLPA